MPLAIARMSAPNGTETRRLMADGCVCTREAGDNVWRCNGKCSDGEMANLP